MARAVAGGVRVEGLNGVVRALLQLGLDAEDLKEAFGPIAAEGARVAAGFVHSRTGRLAGTVRGNRARNKAVIVAGRGRVKYAGVQNYGWPRRNVKAQEFMQKADAVMEPQAVRRLEQAINNAIDRRGLG
jgi:hypothetical protein